MADESTDYLIAEWPTHWAPPTSLLHIYRITRNPAGFVELSQNHQSGVIATSAQYMQDYLVHHSPAGTILWNLKPAPNHFDLLVKG